MKPLPDGWTPQGLRGGGLPHPPLDDEAQALHSAVQGLAAQTELGGSARHDPSRAGQRAFDHLPLCVAE